MKYWMSLFFCGLYYSAAGIICIISNVRMSNDRWIEKDLEGSSLLLTGVCSQHFPGEAGKNRMKPVTVSGVLYEIDTRDLPVTSPACHFLHHLACKVLSVEYCHHLCWRWMQSCYTSAHLLISAFVHPCRMRRNQEDQQETSAENILLYVGIEVFILLFCTGRYNMPRKTRGRFAGSISFVYSPVALNLHAACP